MKKLIFIIIVLSLFMVGCSNPASGDYSDNVPVVDTENGNNGNSSNEPNNPGTNNGGNQDNPPNSGNGGTTTNPGNPSNPTDVGDDNDEDEQEDANNGSEGGNTKPSEKIITFKLYEDSDLELGSAEYITELKLTVSNNTVSNLIESIKSKYNDYNERVVNIEYCYDDSDYKNYYFDENANKISREITTKRNYESNYNIYYKDFDTKNKYNMINEINFRNTIIDPEINNELSLVVKYTDSIYVSRKVKINESFELNEFYCSGEIIPFNVRLLTKSEFMSEMPNLTDIYNKPITSLRYNIELHEGYHRFENGSLLEGKNYTVITCPQYYTYSWIDNKSE